MVVVGFFPVDVTAFEDLPAAPVTTAVAAARDDVTVDDLVATAADEVVAVEVVEGLEVEKVGGVTKAERGSDVGINP